MVTFVDGPAAGVTLRLTRAPIYLRATRCGDTWDALDQTTDHARADESLYAYRVTGQVGNVHINSRDAHGRRNGGWFKIANYVLIEPQPGDEVMRVNQLWGEWAEAEHARQSLRDTLDPPE